MKRKAFKTLPLRGDGGFTAIEIAMVAAVIAILSLIVLPIFRNRVEDAKVAAAQADLSALMKAEQVVKADIDAYARLEDLDNVELFNYTGIPANGLTKEVPTFKYIQPRGGVSPDPQSRYILPTTAERTKLAGTPDLPVWRGPYIAFQRSMTYADIKNPAITSIGPFVLRSSVGAFAAIQDINASPIGINDSDDNRIPVDPWGNPYLFFPPTGSSPDVNGATAFPSSVIYSMGPNGLPGDGSAGAVGYLRESTMTSPGPGNLGKFDDLMVEF